MLEHGGRLRAAARQYGIAIEAWVDLSTGINPCGWPVPPLPAALWQRLPEDDDGLIEAAADYYGSAHMLAVAGSQAAIQTLPAVLPGTSVAILAPTYAEHPHAWRGCRPRVLGAGEVDAAAGNVDVLVVVNPNNPTGTVFERNRVLAWLARQQARGGWLVVDEAFMDCTPAHSIADHGGTAGLVVLRSLGKFFGLAGARVGFILAPLQLRLALAERLGPWALSGPAREVARLALADRAWQESSRHQLAAAGERLHAMLQHRLGGNWTGTALFRWQQRHDAAAVHEALARQGILVRLFAENPALRFGLPADEHAWQRLDDALRTIASLTHHNSPSVP